MTAVRYLPLAARILISAIFLVSGFAKITDWNGTAQHMASEGMPLIPLFLAAAIVIEVGGGLCLLFGYKTKIAAAALVIFLVPVTLIFHDFWTYDGQAMVMQMANFMKNLAIMGGLLHFMATGPGYVSIDERVPDRVRARDDFPSGTTWNPS